MGLDLSARSQDARPAGLRVSSGGCGGEVVETPMQELLRKMDEMRGQVRELVVAHQDMRDDMRYIKAQAAMRAEDADVGSSTLASGMSSPPRKADGSTIGRTGTPSVASEAATDAEIGGAGVDGAVPALQAQAYRANGVPGVGLGYAV
jgi:hypothetical protein